MTVVSQKLPRYSSYQKRLPTIVYGEAFGDWAMVTYMTRSYPENNNVEVRSKAADESPHTNLRGGFNPAPGFFWWGIFCFTVFFFFVWAEVQILNAIGN